jgi:hypothetical protein
MTTQQTTSRFTTFVCLGQSGKRSDIDRLMTELVTRDDMATAKLIDYALSLVATREGMAALREYLFQGLPQQRNYAALFFKRKGHLDLLDEAVAQGKIDHKQAYLK